MPATTSTAPAAATTAVPVGRRDNADEDDEDDDVVVVDDEGPPAKDDATTTAPSAAQLKLMDQLFLNPSQPSAYASVAKLVKAARAHGIGKATVRHYLAGQDGYTLHKSARKRFQRNRILTFHPYDLWQADLADVQSLASANDGMRYLLVVIDTFSKMLHVEPLGSKHGPVVATAMQKILDRATAAGGRTSKTHITVDNLQTDKGTTYSQIINKFSNQYSSNNQ